MKRKIWFRALALGVILSSGALGVSAASTYAKSGNRADSHSHAPFQHIFVIMMENESASTLVGNPSDPFVNQLIATYGYDNNYFGVTHVSLPNYVAALTGNNWYSNSDDPTQMFDHRNLVDQLNTHRLTWKAYMQSIPYPGFTGYWYPNNLPAGTSPSVTPSNALYAKKHDPFLLMSDVANSAQAKQVVPLRQLTADLTDGHVPDFVWITPNVINDMHGQSPGTGATLPYTNEQQLISAGDQFLKQWVTTIMDSSTWKHSRSLMLITWDEAGYPGANPTPQQLQSFTAPGPDSPVVPAGSVDGFSWPGGAYGGGQVPLLILDNQRPGHFVLNTWADHYTLLRTIEKNWGLGTLGMASDNAQVKALPLK